MVQSLFHLVVELAVVGAIYWLVSYLPIAQPFKQIINVIFIVIAVILVLAVLLPLAGLHL